MAARAPIAQVADLAAREYRAALAAAVLQEDPSEHWDGWQDATAVLILAAWTEGAKASLRVAGVPRSLAVANLPPVTFDRIPEDVAFGFEAGPMAEAVARLVEAVPLTRQRWEQLIAAAREAASELRETESADALERILERSPALRAVVRPQAGGAKPAGFQPAVPRKGEVKRPKPGSEAEERRNIAVQRVTQGAFFVTGMTPRQIKQTQQLLARVIRGEEAVSTAGKAIEQIGVGDFVSLATLETGTDLTAARLETVYRTNLNRAQSQGALDVCREEIVQRFVPLMRFSATRDKRTRPTHRAFDGYIATVTQIDAQGIPTPLGFNCRCAWIPVPIAEAVRLKLCDEDGAPDFDAIRRHNGARQRLVDTAQLPDAGFIAG